MVGARDPDEEEKGSVGKTGCVYRPPLFFSEQASVAVALILLLMLPASWGCSAGHLSSLAALQRVVILLCQIRTSGVPGLSQGLNSLSLKCV